GSHPLSPALRLLVLLLVTLLDQLRQHLLVFFNVLFGVRTELLTATVSAKIVNLPLVGHLRERRPIADDAERPRLIADGGQRLPLLGGADQVDLVGECAVLWLHLVLVQEAVVVQETDDHALRGLRLLVLPFQNEAASLQRPREDDGLLLD